MAELMLPLRFGLRASGQNGNELVTGAATNSLLELHIETDD